MSDPLTFHQETNNTVGIGSRVTLKMKNKIYEFKIINSGIADPNKGTISNKSPLGKVTLGARVGDGVRVKTSSSNHLYRVLKIS